MKQQNSSQRNVLYNLIGLGLPLLVAIYAIPILINLLGVARFGILTLIWTVVSYFGLFDLGLGRAMTQQLAGMWALGESEKEKFLVSAALSIMASLGIGAGVLLALSAVWFVDHLSGVINRQEIVHAIYAMSVAIPFIILSSGLRGVLEAKSAFGIVNAIRLPISIYTFLAPIAVIRFCGNNLGLIAISLAIGRIIGCVSYAWYCRYSFPILRKWFDVDKYLLKKLLLSGGWMTVSNVISPLIGYLDRFLIGLVISISAVAYYATPNEMIYKLWIIPGSLMAVLFPHFAKLIILDRLHLVDLFRRSIMIIFMTIYPISLGIVLFSRDILSLWLGKGFAEHSYHILQIFAFGILVNCLAQAPFTLLQAVGRANTTAKIHAGVFPFYAVILWVWLHSYGLIGAAIAWLLRILIDTILMFIYAIREIKNIIGHIFSWKYLFATIYTLLTFAELFINSRELRLLAWLLSVICMYAIFWYVLFRLSDKASLAMSLGRDIK